jgi:hypothetical protein
LNGVTATVPPWIIWITLCDPFTPKSFTFNGGPDEDPNRTTIGVLGSKGVDLADYATRSIDYGWFFVQPLCQENCIEFGDVARVAFGP